MLYSIASKLDLGVSYGSVCVLYSVASMIDLGGSYGPVCILYSVASKIDLGVLVLSSLQQYVWTSMHTVQHRPGGSCSQLVATIRMDQ